MPSHSGKFILRTPPELHAVLRGKAERRGVSLNQLCVSLLSGESDGEFEAFLAKLPIKVLGLLRYGSVVRRENTSSSDIDWLLIVDDSVTIDRELYRQIDQADLPDGRISIHVSHLPDPGDDISNLWLELALEAETLFDPSGVVHQTLIEIRRLVAMGRYRRNLAHGQPYWVRAREGANAKSKTR